MGSSIAHVCGHLHTLGGFVPHMYGKHPSGHLELELADFTDSRRSVMFLNLSYINLLILQISFDGI